LYQNLQNKPRKIVALEGTVERFAGTALDVLEGMDSRQKHAGMTDCLSA
jgi:hypothetical protein